MESIELYDLAGAVLRRVSRLEASSSAKDTRLCELDRDLDLWCEVRPDRERDEGRVRERKLDRSGVGGERRIDTSGSFWSS